MPLSLPPSHTQLVLATAETLRAAPHGGQGAVVRRAAESLGCSVTTLYRWLKAYAGWESGRKCRADKGRTAVPREVALMVAGMVNEATRANGKRTMSIKLATQILEANGLGAVNQQTGEVVMPSPGTVARAMREQGCHPVQLKTGKPSVRMQSLHPNHTWQADASVCVIYKLPTGAMGLMDEKKYYKNKPHHLASLTGLTVIRWVVTDHFSGCVYLRYELGAEDAKGLIDTLIGAMTRRDVRDPMHGAPCNLGFDKGSGNTSGLVQNFLRACSIKPHWHAQGNPRASGAVEKTQDIVETQFESRLRFMDVPSIETLQATADAWRMGFNHTARHSRHKRTRNAMWLTISNEQLRITERAALEAAAVWKAQTRTIKPDFTVSCEVKGYGRQQYDLRELGYHGLNIGDTVTLTLNVFSAPALIIGKTFADGTEKSWHVQPMQFTEAGFDANAAVFGEEFKSLPDTATDKVLKEIKTMAYGVSTAAEADAAKKAGVKPFATINPMADVRRAPLTLARAGTPLTLAAKTAEPAPLSHVQACMRVRALITEVWASHAAACNAYIKTAYPVTVPETEVENIAQSLRERFGKPVLATVTVLPFKTANVGGAACTA